MTPDQQTHFQKLAYEMGKQAALEKDAGFLGALWKPVSWASKGLQKILGGGGSRIVRAAGGEGTHAGKFLAMAGKNAPRDMAMFGGFGAGMGAITNPEDRWGGALKGFAGGMASGLGWRAGSNILRAGQGKLLGMGYGGKKAKQVADLASRKAFTPKVEGAKNQWFWNRTAPGMGPREIAKSWGAKAALGTIPFTGAMAGSELLAAPFHGGDASGAVPQQSFQPQPYHYQPQYYQQGY